MKALDDWRQQGIVTQADLNAYPITVIGAGGIGSPTVLALAKMGCEDITVYDPDIIEQHNLMNQMYRIQDVDEPKVIALQDIVANFTGSKINAIHEEYTDQPLTGIVISGVDSMAVRKTIWSQVKFKPQVVKYIEGRMGAELCIVNTLNVCDPDDIRWYEETCLYSDEEAVETPCTERAIIYNVFMISSLIASQVKKFSNGDEMHKHIIKDLLTLTSITM